MLAHKNIHLQIYNYTNIYTQLCASCTNILTKSEGTKFWGAKHEAYNLERII